MLQRFLFTLCLFVWVGDVSGNDTIPASPQAGPVAIANATIHPVSGPVIDRGWIVMIDGRIDRLGEGALPIADDVEVIDATGKHVYPGLFDASTVVGLIEIAAVRATRDNIETGQINPNVLAHVAVNPDSEITPTARSNGVLLINVTPAGGLVSGQSSVMMLDGWTWEQMTLASPSALVIRWPRMVPGRSWDNEETEKRQIEARDRDLAALEKALEQARAYRIARAAADKSSKPIDFDARWEAMIPYLDGTRSVLIEAEEVSQIEASIAFARRHGLKMVLVGASDAMRAIESIRANKVPVILSGTHSLPRSPDDAIDEPFTLPARLHATDVLFAIAGNGMHGNVRNLPYQAGMAAAYGLSRDEAIASITLRPAQILGVADRVGSLEPGKDATLFIASGDILEVPTRVEAAWIQGRRLDLTDKHKRLNEKYRKRLSGQ
jgi:imidazolonepropionase-like amidohydrolase